MSDKELRDISKEIEAMKKFLYSEETRKKLDQIMIDHPAEEVNYDRDNMDWISPDYHSGHRGTRKRK